MEMYCGIALHATNSWLCVVDAAGQPQLEVRVPNRLEAVRARLEPYREQLSAVAVESTFNRSKCQPNCGSRLSPGRTSLLAGLEESQSIKGPAENRLAPTQQVRGISTSRHACSAGIRLAPVSGDQGPLASRSE